MQSLTIKLLALLACLPLSAATYYVATTGSDSHTTAQAQNALTPWATISKAATVVNAGDTVNVAAGTYAEYVSFTRSGLSGQPIIWIGERSGDDWLTIIDASSAVGATGWTQATGDFTNGQRAYKKSVATQPHLLTLGGLSLVEMQPGGRDWLLAKLGYATDYSDGVGFGSKLWWGASDYLWTYYNGYLYVRVRDGSSPAALGIQSSPRSVGVQMNGLAYNTFQDINFRGARYPVQWINGVSNLIIERCLIEQGHRGISATGNTTACTIRSNVFRGSHLTTVAYGPRSASYPATDVEYQLYRRNKYEWGKTAEGPAIGLFNLGINNLIHDNTITNIAVGVLMSQGDNKPHLARNASGTIILRNTVRDVLHGLMIGAGHGAITVASNSIHRAHYAFRMQNFNVVPANDDPYLIYGNTASSTNLVGYGMYIHAWPTSLLGAIGNPSVTPSGRQEMWLYHNSFSGLVNGYYLSEYFNDGGLPRLYTVNNLWSCERAFNRTTSGGIWAWGAGMLGAVDYNSWLFRSSWSMTDAGPNNVTLPDYEWPITSEPDFEISDDSGGRAAGINISAAFTVNSVAHAALPGFSPGYYESDRGPDIGAWQYSPGAEVPLVSVTATDSLAHESTLATGTFTLTRTESLTGTLTVDYTITGTATADTDYVDDLGTSITFADGDGSTNLVVTPLGNGGYYGNQTVILTLAADAAYLLRQPISATITIIEGDPQPGSLTRPPAPGHSPATRIPRL